MQMQQAAAQGGGPAAIEKQHAKGKLTARERLDLLFDAGSFAEIDAFVQHRCHDFDLEKKVYSGDGVVGGYGKINGRPAFAYAQDFTVLGGSMGEEQANKICKLIRLAMEAGAPIIALNDSGGARIQEGVNSLTGYAKIFYWNTQASGVIPQICAVLGPCAGGAVYSPALMDFIFVVDNLSNMFITGPGVIKAVTGENVTAEVLGGASTHSAISGNAHFRDRSEQECIARIRTLLSYLPGHYQKALPLMGKAAEAQQERPALDTIIPDRANKAYDILDVLHEIADDSDILEYMADYAKNIVTAFIRIGGTPVGVIASQPRVSAGCLDVNAADKSARFIRTCDALGLPLVTLVDVPGFLPGTSQEHQGIIRHGAKLLYAYSEATVPKLTVILRKAYGGAYIAMCSKELGADLVFAWPTAEIAVMGDDGAANILCRDEKDPQARAAWKEQYSKTFLNPYCAAARGQVDMVIRPSETRQRLLSGLELLRGKARAATPKHHGNIPL